MNSTYNLSGKPLAQAEALTDSVAAVEKLIKAERENVKLLEGRLAEAEKQLEATRASLVGSSPEIDTLQDQLRIATQNGMYRGVVSRSLRCLGTLYSRGVPEVI